MGEPTCTTTKVHVTIEASGARSLEVHDHPRLVGGCSILLPGVTVVLDPDATAQLLGVLIGRTIPLSFDTGARRLGDAPANISPVVRLFPGRGGSAA